MDSVYWDVNNFFDFMLPHPKLPSMGFSVRSISAYNFPGRTWRGEWRE